MSVHVAADEHVCVPVEHSSTYRYGQPEASEHASEAAGFASIEQKELSILAPSLRVHTTGLVRVPEPQVLEQALHVPSTQAYVHVDDAKHASVVAGMLLPTLQKEESTIELRVPPGPERTHDTVRCFKPEPHVVEQAEKLPTNHA